jgi:hypothetical protein
MRLFRALAVGAAVIAVLAGCNGDDTAAAPNPSPSPSESEPASQSPSPSSTPPPSPPPVPPHGITEQAAVDFSYYYIEVANHAMLTGDTQSLDDASLPSCRACNALIEGIDKVYAAGGSAKGGTWRPRHYSAIENGQGRWTVAVTVTQGAQVVRNSDTAAPKRVEPDRYTVIVDVIERRSGLGIDRLEVQL